MNRPDRTEQRRMAGWPTDEELEGAPAARPEPDRRRDLARELDAATDYPESWRPEVGDRLVGRLLRYTRAQSAYGPAWVAVVAPDDGGPPLAVWLTPKVLAQRFAELRPAPGERLGVKRLPDADGPRPYKRFAVVADRPAEEPDWDALEVADDGEHRP